MNRFFQWFAGKTQDGSAKTWEETVPGATLRFTEQRLLRISQTMQGRIITSPDGRHVAYWSGTSRNFIPVIDGKPQGARYTNFTPVFFTFSANSRQAIYPAQHADDCKWYVVTDHGEIGPYDRVTNFPIGTRTPYSALLATHGKEEVLLIDGVPGQPYEKIMPGFSLQDGHRVMYLGKRKRKWYVAVDGKEVKAFTQPWPIYPSPDLNRVAWSVKQDDGSRILMIDGEAHGPFSMHGPAVYSADSTRMGYCCQRDGQSFVIIDGEEFGPYDDASTPYFSPDSRHVAYIVTRGSGSGLSQSLIVDGQSGPDFDGMYAITFSPNSERVAYIATSRETQKQCLVIDHQLAGKWYDLVGAWGGNLYFTEDSRHLACIARDGQQWQLQFDGASVGHSYDQFVNSFQMDGPTALHCTMHHTGARSIEVLRISVEFPTTK